MVYVLGSIRESRAGESLGSVLVLTALFKILIEYVYFDFLSSASEWPFSPDLMKYAVGFAVTLGLAFVLVVQTRNRPVMRIAITIFFLFLAVPILSYFAIADRTWIYPTLVVASLFVTLQFSRLPLVDFVQRFWLTQRTTTVLVGLILVHTIGFYSALTYWYGLPPLSPLFFENTYEIRATLDPVFPSLKFSGSPVFGYFQNWQVKVFNPFLLGFFFKKRQYGLMAVVGFLTVLVYMYIPETISLVIPAFVLSVLILFRFRRVTTGMLTFGIVGVVAAYLIFYFGDVTTFVYQGVARGFYIEARNEFYFYQWFQQNPLVYFTDSPLNPFWEDPYNGRVTYLYAERYIGSAHNANPGYLADGYGQLGAIGTVGFGVVVGAFLWALDSFALRSDPEMVVVVAAIPVFNFTQADLTTNILTNGLLLAVIISALYATGDSN